MSNSHSNGAVARKQCHICYTFYAKEIEIGPSLNAEDVKKIKRNCSKYLFEEVINFLERTGMASIDLPFCVECFTYIHQISNSHDQLEEIQRQISVIVDEFTLKVLKCRKNVMNTSDPDPNGNLVHHEIQTEEIEVPSNDLIQDYDDGNYLITNSSNVCDEETDNDVVIERFEIKFVPIPVITIEDETPIVSQSSTSKGVHDESEYYLEHVKEAARQPQSSKETAPCPLPVFGFRTLEIKLEKLQFDEKGCVLSPVSTSVSVPTEVTIPTHNATTNSKIIIPSKVSTSGPPLPIPRKYRIPIRLRRKRPVIPTVRNAIILAKEKQPSETVTLDEDAPPVLVPLTTSKLPFSSSHQHIGKCTARSCPTCKKSFTYKLAWTKHCSKCSDSSSQGQPVHSCQVCGKKFEKLNHLKNHTRGKTSCREAYLGAFGGTAKGKGTTDKASFPCNICQREFSREVDLKKHTTRIHTDKTLTCRICKKMFKRKGDLKKHTTFKHIKRNCAVCGVLFKNLATLVIHRKTHSSKFECQFCEKSYSYQAHLKKHLILAHVKESQLAHKKSKEINISDVIAVPTNTSENILLEDLHSTVGEERAVTMQNYSSMIRKEDATLAASSVPNTYSVPSPSNQNTLPARITPGWPDSSVKSASVVSEYWGQETACSSM